MSSAALARATQASASARVEGVVRSTKPLSYQGTLIQDIEVRFEGGRIVHSSARTGAEVLERVQYLIRLGVEIRDEEDHAPPPNVFRQLDQRLTARAAGAL